MTIDGTNIYVAYGAELLDGSMSSVLTYPTRKAVNYTNYAEVNGITPDLRRFETEPRTVTLQFGIIHNTAAEFPTKHAAFFNMIKAPGYRTMVFDGGLTLRLRYASTSNYAPTTIDGRGGTKFSMSFAEDDCCISPSVVTGGQAARAARGWYKIDGTDFAAFGVTPDRALGSVLAYPSVKPPFTDGRQYYTDVVKEAHKEISLPLAMCADSQAAFIQNWQAFFNAWAKTGIRRLYVRETGGTEYEAYYKGCSSMSVVWGERPAAKFTVGVVLCNHS